MNGQEPTVTLDLDGIRGLLERRANPGATHWEGCYTDHVDCAAVALLGEVERLRDGLRKLADPYCDCGVSHHGGHDYGCATRVDRVHVAELWELLEATP